MVIRAKNAPSPVFSPNLGEKVSEIWNMPLTPPSPVTPRREEGKHIEIRKKFPPP